MYVNMREGGGISWFKRESFEYTNVLDGLKQIYKSKLLPLEEDYYFHDFHSPKLNDPDFDAKPLILFMGQYSTGKTTLIKYILKSEFLGMRIGPEPTTDRFMVIMHDEKAKIIPGNALVVDPNKPFSPLSKYGNSFLTKFQCSTLNNPILQGISLVDTPGILSGEKQRVDRGYDFTGVLEWFAERVDRIILLFDAHKLDISDEFRRSIEALKGHDEKIRIILNKADMVDHQSLMRIYGSLMWSLGKIINTPEVARVYVGSFWDQSLKNNVYKQLFEDEEQDLLKDIQSLPKNSALRKLNDLHKRVRLAKTHAYIMDALKTKMPVLFGKATAKENLVNSLPEIFTKLQMELKLSPGDFPDVKKMQNDLKDFNFDYLKSIDQVQINDIDYAISTEITKLMIKIHDDDDETSKGLQELQG
ncbi:EH-domain-containing protein, putative [Pediculus humanus corporis]|uniref:EH-domain-containing protein, putative n=1 Tax=Pediculus humanus subsp. corporis TaxID=121224 RepID=E0VHS5_PEDHC|nr:EH-domain-containing protein, putative [Pediculus humanus corporis]EEB12848.1 EH-domain-containing protein, putative [Pediculus humanus corporis]